MKIKTKLHSCLQVTLLLVTVLCIPATAKALYFDVDHIRYVTNDDNTVTVAWVDKDGDIVIPPTVTYDNKTYTVTGIAGIFYYDIYNNSHRTITGISIPSTVTQINIIGELYDNGVVYESLRVNDALTHITIASGNPRYDSRDNCNAIIETASNTLLVGCNNTTFVPNTVTAIRAGAFYYCSGLTSITLPNSLTTIGAFAFQGCSGLSEITLPNTLTTIGVAAFSNCSNLTSITLPNTLTTIADEAFCNCSKLESVNIPSSVTEIGAGAFWGCSDLTEIALPNSINIIGDGAFGECLELTNINIPSSVTEIGPDAFYNTKITEDQHGIVYVGNWVVGYKNDLPGDCVIKNGTVGIASYTFDYHYFYESAIEPPFTNLVIPNSVLYIGDDVFYYQGEYQYEEGHFEEGRYKVSPIKTIVIGKSVKTIGSHSFYTGSQSRYNDNGTLIDGDVDLQSITCLAKVPPQTSDAFASYILDNPIYGWYETDYVIYHRVPLYVPMESVEAYKSDEEWGRFQTIVGIEARDPSDVNGDGEVTIADVNCIVHEILYLYISPNNLEYDVNGDGEVTIADVNAVIDAILGN